MAIAEIISHGASIHRFRAPDGRNVILSFDNVDNYKDPRNPFFGATIGRVANRIYGAEVTVDGTAYKLTTTPKHSTPVALHGGVGWDKKSWSGPALRPLADERDDKRDGEQAVLTYHSPHLDEGFPGAVDAVAAYSSYKTHNKTVLVLDYSATVASDSPIAKSVVGMTNHNFFDLGGPVDEVEACFFRNDMMQQSSPAEPPTYALEAHPALRVGEFVSLRDVHIDRTFLAPNADLDRPELDTRQRALEPLVQLRRGALNIKVLSTEPVFQFYTTEYMNVPLLSGETREFPKRLGIAVEPGRPTNAAANKYKPWVEISKGHGYGSLTVYECWYE